MAAQSGGQVPGHDPRAAERGLEPHGPVIEVQARILIGQIRPGPLVHLRGQLGQVPQVHPGGHGGQQDLVGGLPRL